MNRYVSGRDICRARRALGSPFIAALPGMMRAVDRNAMPYTLFACGDLLSPEDASEFTAPIHVPARVVVAHKISSTLSIVYNNDADRVQQRLWGDLCATFYPGMGTSIDDANDRLREINALLNQHPVESAAVIAAFTHIWDRAGVEAAMPASDWEDVEDVIPEAFEIPRVAYQKGMAYRRSLHAARWARLIQINPVQLNALAGLVNVTEMPEPAASFPATVFLPAANYEEGWRGLVIQEKMAIMEAIYFSQQVTWDAQIVASVAGTIFGICKTAGCTDAWLTSRLTQLTNLFPDFELANKVTVPAMKLFTQNYLTNHGDVGGLINFLKSIYNTLSDSNLKCLSWVIEQARSNNCTHLTAFASAIVAFNGRPLILLNNVPEVACKEFMKAGTAVVIDPFGSILAPLIPASRYPDYANFGVEAKRRLDAVFRNYVVQEIKGGKYRMAQLRDIVGSCMEHMNDQMENAANPVTVLSKQLSELTFEEIGNAIYVYDHTDRALHLNQETLRQVLTNRYEPEAAAVPPEEPAARQAVGRAIAILDPLHGVEVEQVDENARVTWARRAQQLPRNAVKLTPDHVESLMDVVLECNPKLDSLKRMSELVDAAARQAVLNPYGDDPSNIAIINRYDIRQVGNLNYLLEPWGLTVNDIFPDLPPNAPVEPYNDDTMDDGSSLDRPIRNRIFPHNAPQPQGAQAPPPEP